MNEEIAIKLLATVDAGLTKDIGRAVPGEMCVEAAINYAMCLPHDDKPPCVSEALRAFGIAINECAWSSPDARAKGLRRFSIAQLGSAGELDDAEFARRLTALIVNKWLARSLRSYGYLELAAKAETATGNYSELIDAIRCKRRFQWSRMFRVIKAHDPINKCVWAGSMFNGNDKLMSEFAEDVVQILIDMNAPGCKWLRLTER